MEATYTVREEHIQPDQLRFLGRSPTSSLEACRDTLLLAWLGHYAMPESRRFVLRMGSIFVFNLGRLMEDDVVEPVAGVIAEALSKLDAEIDSLMKQSEAAEDPKEQWQIDNMVDDQALVYDELLGTLFITWQIAIERTVAEIGKMHSLAERRGVALTTTTRDKVAIMQYGSSSSGPSSIEVINAAANYQKHSDAWPRDWDVNPAAQNYTVQVLLAIGATSESHVVQKCAEHLGCVNPSQTGQLGDAITEWRRGLARDYTSELVVRRLHPAGSMP